MKITLDWLKEKGACKESYKWFEEQKDTDSIDLLKKLIEEGKLDWANWAIGRLMTYKQQVQYAVFAAERVIELYEAKYPADKRPRQAIEAARQCIDDPSNENKKAATTASEAATAASEAATAAYYAAVSAASEAASTAASEAAVSAASFAATAGFVVSVAATAGFVVSAGSAGFVVSAGSAAFVATQKKIATYGLRLLEEYIRKYAKQEAV